MILSSAIPKITDQFNTLGDVGWHASAYLLTTCAGGAFTDNPKLTWRWCFYIDLPLGLLVALIILFCIPCSVKSGKNASKQSIFSQIKEVDPIGTLFVLPDAICLLLAPQWGGTVCPWKSGRVSALLVVGPLL